MDRSSSLKDPQVVADIYKTDGSYQYSVDITRSLVFPTHQFSLSPIRIHHLSDTGSLYVSGIVGPNTVSVYHFSLN